jgi:hypothetical protein
MTSSTYKFYLHVTLVPKSISIERRPFSDRALDQFRLLIGDKSGHCHVEITRRLFANPLFVIAADDNFNNKRWSVTTVISDRWFRGAVVILAERNRDPEGRSFIGDTFLDGLTEDECNEASRYIAPPPSAQPSPDISPTG